MQYMTGKMANEGLKLRHPPTSVPVIEKLRAQRTDSSKKSTEATAHPAGEIKHGVFFQGVRMVLFALYFAISILA